MSSADELPHHDHGRHSNANLENDPSGVLQLILHVHIREFTPKPVLSSFLKSVCAKNAIHAKGVVPEGVRSEAEELGRGFGVQGKGAASPFIPCFLDGEEIHRLFSSSSVMKDLHRSGLLREQRMEVQVAQVSYSWVYSLTPLGIDLFKNDKLQTAGRGTEWSTPADITGINLTKTYEDKAVFAFADGGWHLAAAASERIWRRTAKARKIRSQF